MMLSLGALKPARKMLVAVALCGLHQASAVGGHMSAEPKRPPTRFTPIPTPPPTAHAPFAPDDHDRGCPAYDMSKLNNFSGVGQEGHYAMREAGWIFSNRDGHWDPDTVYKPYLGNLVNGGLVKKLPPTSSYWGYDFPGDGVIRLALHGSGTLSLNVGNAYYTGRTRVGLEPLKQPIGLVQNNTLTQVVKHRFEDGYMLTIEEDKPRGIVVINNISFTCDKRCSSEEPLGWCKSGYFCSKNHKCEKLDDIDFCLQQAPEWNSAVTCKTSKIWCESWAKDMQRCCPKTCGAPWDFRETECKASESNGTCVYPRPEVGSFESLDGTWTAEPIHNKQLSISGGTLYANEGTYAIYRWTPGCTPGRRTPGCTPGSFSISEGFSDGGSASYKPISGVDKKITTITMANKVIYKFKSETVATYTTPMITVSQREECFGSQTLFVACNTHPCDSNCTRKDCVLGEWADWSSCECTALQERGRVVTQENNECGEPCKGSLIETRPCEPKDCHNEANETKCKIGDWSPWGDCSPSYDLVDGMCGSDQLCRTRESTCTEPEVQTKGKPAAPCEVSDWGTWSECSASCGTGSSMRKRQITREATVDGTVCVEDLSQTKHCVGSEADCPMIPVDENCTWGDWTDWSACTCTCDGGQKTRDRRILTSPKGNGARCQALPRSEIAPCNVQACYSSGPCQDGEWGDWTRFMQCTAECGGGLTWRSRKRVREANECGRPAEGRDKEYLPCNTQSCGETKDCELGDWSDWSACSCTCNGVKRRGRLILKYGHGDGAGCNGVLKEIHPCNTPDSPDYQCAKPSAPGLPLHPPEEPSELSDWDDWDTCTVTCGVGQIRRQRRVLSEGSPPLVASLEETQGCQKKPCTAAPTPAPSCKECTEVVNCSWSDWDDWGACDKCGGQRKRFRHIEQMPKNGGNPCSPDPYYASEETDACPRLCHDMFLCEWGAWVDESACSKECGGGTKKKTRSLTAVSVSHAQVSPAQVSPAQLIQKVEYPQDAQEHAIDHRETFLGFACGSLVTFVLFSISRRVSGCMGARQSYHEQDQAARSLVELTSAINADASEADSAFLPISAS